jgi:hypothetical protein
MAIYHLTVKVIGRSAGQSAIASAAYRSGEKLTDEATGQVKQYPARGERIRFTGIFAPAGAPSWVYDRNRLWNAAEQAEKRKDATLAREVIVALPHELTDQQREWLVSDFVREAFVRRGLVADVAIHAPDRNSDSRNYHAHILITERTIKGDGKPSEKIRAPETAGEFSPDRQGDAAPVDPGFDPKKDRSLYGKETLYSWRSHWGNLCNRHLARHGHAARVDHRTLAEQRIDREPTRHLGRVDAQRMRRGVSTVRGDGLRATRIRNALRAVTGAAREIASLREPGAGRVGAGTGIRVAAKAAASSMFNPPAKEPHDYCTGKIVEQFLALCDDPLHNLPRWMDTQGRHRGDGDRLLARQGASVGGDVGMQSVRGHDSPAPHHPAEAENAGDADYRKPIHSAVATVASLCAAAEVTRRPMPEPEPCSYEAEAGAIVARYASVIEAARCSNKPRHEIETIIRALRHQQAIELAGIRDRRKARAGQRPQGMG